MENQEKYVGLTDQEIVRREKLEKLREFGIDPFGHSYKRTHLSSELKELYGGKTHEELEEMHVEVSVAGRIMANRGKGKVAFINIQDLGGNIQVYVRKDVIGEEVLALAVEKKTPAGYTKEWNINGEKVTLGVQK